VKFPGGAKEENGGKKERGAKDYEGEKSVGEREGETTNEPCSLPPG